MADDLPCEWDLGGAEAPEVCSSASRTSCPLRGIAWLRSSHTLLKMNAGNRARLRGAAHMQQGRVLGQHIHLQDLRQVHRMHCLDVPFGGEGSTRSMSGRPERNQLFELRLPLSGSDITCKELMNSPSSRETHERGTVLEFNVRAGKSGTSALLIVMIVIRHLQASRLPATGPRTWFDDPHVCRF